MATAPQHGPRPLPLFLDILWRQTEGNAALRERAFAGLARYQRTIRPARPPAPHCAASAGQARLFHFDAERTESNGPPIVLIPSLINPPDVLDLSERQSLARWLSARGHDVWLVDWGTPTAADAALDLGGHAEQRLLPLLGTLDRPPMLVGYCLGGTLAMAAAGACDAVALATIAAPWNFDGFPDPARQEVARLWQEARPLGERLGYMPMEVLQSGFWTLDPARTIRKYAAFADMEPGSDAEHGFLAVEDWANGGAPLTFAAARELFDDLYAENVSGRGAWKVAGRIVDPTALPCPSFSVRSATDAIVPAASSPELDENRLLGLGHVGMIVGGRARSMLWEPLSEWLFNQTP